MKCSPRSACSLLRDDKGAVAVLVAFLILGLVGMTALVVDIGLLYQARRELVNAADAAALAGAQQLYRTQSTSSAESHARQFAVSNYGLDPSRVAVTARPDSRTVAVEASSTVELTFAAVVGVSSLSVPARAVAVYAPLGRMAALRPIGISESLWREARESGSANFAFSSAMGVPGAWGFIYFPDDNHQDATIRVRTRDGDGRVAIGEDVYLIRGFPSGGGNVDPDNVQTHLGRLITNGTVVYLPIVEDWDESPGGGTDIPVEAIGFVAVRFTVQSGSGNNYVLAGEILGDSFAPGFIMPGGQETGLWGVGLIE